MWFLDANTLFLISAAVILIGFMRILNQTFQLNLPIKYIMPFVEVGVIYYIDSKLAIFYMVYIVITYLLGVLLYKAKIFRKTLFFICCVIACIPFFLNRMPALGIENINFLIIIGISYCMLKVIDTYFVIYYGELKIKLLVYINYILFLPVFTSGPIHRFQDFKKSLKYPLHIDGVLIAQSIKRLIRGLFKKLVMAEICMLIFQQLLSVESCWYVSWGIILLSYLILWLDFSGYSDIAIAFGNIAAIRVPENFKHPLRSASMTQFWRNWHVTLSDYIREHIYIIVAKKKLNKFKSGLLAFLTMSLMALWHGFNFNFIISGFYLGMILFFENIFKLTTVNRKKVNKVYFYSRCFITNLLFAINTLIFTLSEPAEIFKVIKGLLIF